MSHEINQRLSRIESLLEQLLVDRSPHADDLVNEIAMVKAQGKDLAEYFKAKSRKNGRTHNRGVKR